MATIVDKIPKKTPPTWEGVYQTMQEAAAVGNGFSGKRWLERVFQQLEDYNLDRKKNGNKALPPRPSSLPFLCSLTNPNSIVDFGGSSGWLWYYIKECIPYLSIEKYDIIEIENICRHFKTSNFHDGSPINYYLSHEIITNYDILYTNSMLQYIENDELFLNIIQTTSPKYILIDNFLGGMINDYISTQIYYEDRIPVKLRNSVDFIDKIKLLNFELIYTAPYIQEIRGIIQPFQMDAFPEKMRFKYGINFLLKKMND